ncbi:biopolymer transportern ExbD [Sphingobium indicum IP26]|uniref:Biopolymer transporter ExbD n=1 Tax=Sphingobium indicum F2 TaxID=1450518 RepID=A0A8E1C2K5_9SPHN|nr:MULTISPECIES: biopolymer transporter ExbD [Sphingobium]EPR17014.1 biopolymer transportern ExbD [Sphingobium indicum IP26]EQB06037.1 biopolymer transportern ExbD [Sphingobium sp. HDIP04]KER34820.1 biopolymer transporter ExbD [Sphingobium indicum F2]KER35000.1 biopolymer transporter ExbD [Sphingobium indicum F2]KER36023.1 biopolymer transporter ExbD [Sphingobium indicum F2]
MALSFARPRPGDGETPMSDMNSTPLIDVMLVLLIMFIITIPLQTHSVGVDLPQTPRELTPPPVDAVKNRVGIDADGTVRWNGEAVDRLTLRQYLAASLRLPAEPELQFQPDAGARYVTVDEVLADIRRAGVTKLGFVGNERYARF